MFAVLSAAEIYRYLDEAPPASVAALAARYERLSLGRSPDNAQIWLNWIMRLRTSGALIGYWQATIESGEAGLGYLLATSYWGKGYAVEAGAIVIDHLIAACGVRRFRVQIDRSNRASLAVAGRLGFDPVDGEDRGDDVELERLSQRGPGASA